MRSTLYEITDASLRALIPDLARPVEAATLALARLDERLAGLGRDPAGAMLADGVRARAHLFEAQALAHLSGTLVGLEDLVLHDAGMDVRAPSTGVVRAAAILNERRQLARRAPEAVLAPNAVRRLIGVTADEGRDAPGGMSNGLGKRSVSPRSSDPKRWEMPWPAADYAERDDDALWPEEDDADGLDLLDPDEDRDEDTDDNASGDLAAVDALLARTRRWLVAFNEPGSGDAPLRLRDPDYGGAERLAAWHAVLGCGEGAPAILAVALALDAWLLMEPAERGGEIGFALAATILRRRGIAAHHLPALGLGYRKGRFRWSPHQALAVRLAGLVEAVAGSARLADADLKRLALAREVMLRRCENRRGNSRLGKLIGLFVESPLVTTGLAAERLEVSPQAVEAMLKELGPSLPRELTGRKRYRAWGIV
jgi:hypothetical protein